MKRPSSRDWHAELAGALAFDCHLKAFDYCLIVCSRNWQEKPNQNKKRKGKWLGVVPSDSKPIPKQSSNLQGRITRIVSE